MECSRANTISASAPSKTLIQYRLQNESFVVERAQAHLPSRLGKGFKIHVFENLMDGREHVALVKGVIDPEKATHVGAGPRRVPDG